MHRRDDWNIEHSIMAEFVANRIARSEIRCFSQIRRTGIEILRSGGGFEEGKLEGSLHASRMSRSACRRASGLACGRHRCCAARRHANFQLRAFRKMDTLSANRGEMPIPPSVESASIQVACDFIARLPD